MQADIDTAHNRAIAREAAAQAITLLKNHEKTLPLSLATFTGNAGNGGNGKDGEDDEGETVVMQPQKEKRKLAVIGPLANATMGMLSNYHPNSDDVPVAMHHSALQVLRARGAESASFAPFYSTGILNIILLPRQARDKHRESTQISSFYQDRLGTDIGKTPKKRVSAGVAFEYAVGSAVECETPHYCKGADRANISAAAAAAANADTVLLFLGMNSNGNNGTGAEFGGQGSSETEAKDRYDIKLRGVQQELLEVRKTPLFGAVFCNKTIKFTKTGSANIGKR